jgi:hypothetical protein
MANAAMLTSTLATVGLTGLNSEGCRHPARSFTILLAGNLSHVRFSPRAVCQLKSLKYISSAQPGFGRRGVGEVAAFVLGKRMGHDVDVGRIVVPPFRFTRDSVTFESADLGPLEPNETFIGTYHTHPDGDLEEGVLSAVDLDFIRQGYVDFHGRVGRLSSSADGVDWLFDIVEPRDGDWNVYAHDGSRLAELDTICKATPRHCPIDELRLAGSRFYLLSRYYEE